MLILDTHIWIWWVEVSPRLKASQKQHLLAEQGKGLGISVISIWEVAQLVSKDRLQLEKPLEQWLSIAVKMPGIQILELTQKIAVEANFLPQPFHRDPADQIIVATARILSVPVLTADAKILNYPHVQLLI